MIRFILYFCLFMSIQAKVQAKDLVPITQLQKAWKLNEIYFDSLYSAIDSTMGKYRLVPALNSLCYIHDGKNSFFAKWEYDDNLMEIRIVNGENNLLFIYKILHIDDGNLIVVVDLSKYNLPVKMVEYRFVPDTNFFD